MILRVASFQTSLAVFCFVHASLLSGCHRLLPFDGQQNRDTAARDLVFRDGDLFAGGGDVWQADGTTRRDQSRDLAKDGSQRDALVKDGYKRDDATTREAGAAFKYIFVTSQMYTGNMGGLGGADSNCQTLANAAGLPGIYMAWLSDDTTSASDRLTHATVPYRLTDGTLVANNWADLTDGTLQHPINLTETKGTPPLTYGPCTIG